MKDVRCRASGDNNEIFSFVSLVEFAVPIRVSSYAVLFFLLYSSDSRETFTADREK